MLKAPFPYFGGKSRVASLVWDHFGDPVNYVEPFFGSGAILLKRPTPARVETVNDIDCYLSNFWRAISADPEAVAHWIENVPPLLTWCDGIFYKRIIEIANAQGYTVVADIVDAVNYGVPQRRRRAIVVGTRGDKHYQFPMPTNWASVSTPNGERTGLGWAAEKWTEDESKPRKKGQPTLFEDQG